MSAQTYKVNEQVRILAAEYAEEAIGKTGSLTGVMSDGAPFRDYNGIDHRFEIRMGDDYVSPGALVFASRIEKVEPEWVVGQVVYGDDFARLPVGSKIQSLAAFPAHFTKVSSGNAWAYTDGAGKTDSPASLDVGGPGRTLIYLPEPEDTDDAYVEAVSTGWPLPNHTGVEGIEPRQNLIPNPAFDTGTDGWSEDDLHAEDTDDVEPEPLKEGDWVQVWAQVNRQADNDGDLLLVSSTYGEAATTSRRFYTRSDAIVRPAEGQVPPWVKPAQCTSLAAAPGSLRRCERDEHGPEMAHLLSGFGSWTTTEEAGRITEGGAS